MKKIYITFSGAAYDNTTQEIVRRAPKMGADEVLVYDDLWLTGTDLYREHRWLWSHLDLHGQENRGFGWFSWKPYIIAHALTRANEGDIVLFTDADTYPIHDFSMLYEECDKIGGIMLFSAVGWKQYQWCKRDCYIRMEQDDPKYYDVQHGVARFMLFQKGGKNVDFFLQHWQKFCVDKLATTFDKSVLGPELEGNLGHRCEQAIMTNVGHLLGLKFYREACQFGSDYPEDQDLFPQLFFQDGNHGRKTLRGSRYRNVL